MDGDTQNLCTTQDFLSVLTAAGLLSNREHHKTANAHQSKGQGHRHPQPEAVGRYGVRQRVTPMFGPNGQPRNGSENLLASFHFLLHGLMFMRLFLQMVFHGGFDGAKMTADQGNHGKSMKIHGNYKQENKENAMENRPLEQWSSFVSSTSTRTRGLFVWMVPGDMCNDQKRALPCSLPMLSSFGTAFNGTVLPQVLMMALTHKPIGRPFAKISRLHLHITKCSRAAFRE